MEAALRIPESQIVTALCRIWPDKHHEVDEDGAPLLLLLIFLENSLLTSLETSKRVRRESSTPDRWLCLCPSGRERDWLWRDVARAGVRRAEPGWV